MFKTLPDDVQAHLRELAARHVEKSENIIQLFVTENSNSRTAVTKQFSTVLSPKTTVKKMREVLILPENQSKFGTSSTST